jgi:hypothetical protein
VTIVLRTRPQEGVTSMNQPPCSLCALLAACSVNAAGICAVAAEKPARPNIVVILADDLSAWAQQELSPCVS